MAARSAPPFASLAIVVPLLVGGCGNDVPLRVEATHDATTGRLTRLAADLNEDGTLDTWTYMNGTTVLRTEQDLDGDGKVERWEYMATDDAETRVALSRRRTGQPDIWIYSDADGQPRRIESASADPARADAPRRVDRIEIFSDGHLTRVEEDTNRDGRMDKWEQHGLTGLVAVDFDLDGDGTPDERVQYGAGGKIVGRHKIAR